MATSVIPRITVRISGRNRLLCEALVRLLRRRTGFCVRASDPGATTGSEFNPDGPCDVLLADSLDACREGDLGQSQTDAGMSGLLLFGMEDNPKQFLEAIRLGASGYLLNDASSDDIVQAIKMVARGEAVCPPKLCMYLFRQVAADRSSRCHEEKGRDERAHSLTMRQRQLMDLVSRGMSNKEIANRLNLSQFTVKNHIRRILHNVEVETRHEAVDVMRASGILPLS